MSGSELAQNRHAALERWPRLENLWRYCRHVDAWINRGTVQEQLAKASPQSLESLRDPDITAEEAAAFERAIKEVRRRA